MEPQAIVDAITAANLRGRGGAGFPTGRKASLLAKDTGKPTYLVINADESEPGAFKDRDVMRFTPHRLIEGCLITAHGIGSESVFIYIRGEYAHEFDVMRSALEEARRAELLGGVTIVLHRGAGAYICGEETALLESLEGQRGRPRPRPPFPPVNGLYGAPTQINNVSTIALVPKIIELGADEFAKIGVAVGAGHRRLLPLRQRHEPGELRASAGYDDPRADLRRRGRRRRRARAQGRHSRRVIRADSHARPDRHADGLRLDRRRARSSAPPRSSSSTTAAAWCSSRSAPRSSTCTSRAESALRAAGVPAGSSSS